MRELDPDALRRLSKTVFERFCRRLLDEEYRRRFEGNTVELEGPNEGDTPDGGYDLWALVSKRAREPAHYSLLAEPSEPGKSVESWFSCKTHKDDGGKRKDPGGWRSQVRQDLDRPPKTAPLVDIKKGAFAANANELAVDKIPPPRELLRILADGGRFIVLVNVGAGDLLNFKAGLRALFEFWIERELGKPVSLGRAQVDVYDSTHLANVFNERPFVLSGEQKQLLALDEPAFVLDWDRWTAAYTQDRRAMDWKPDARRKELTAKLRDFISAPEDHGIFRLWGPPGVGKTRLVYQVLWDPSQVLWDASVTSRVRYCDDALAVLSWLRAPNGKLADDLLLIVDEVAPANAPTLARAFRSYAPSSAKLMVIGPQDLSHQGGPAPEHLPRLDQVQIRAILVVEMSPDDTRLDQVVKLCKGYPLFAYWLGNALANDPELLADPKAALTNDDDPWDATCAVLAGPRGSDEVGWRERATRRAKALLLASLTFEQVWDHITIGDREDLSRLLDMGWDELLAAARECLNRSVLREYGALRYVSPENLERLILNHFFGGDGPGGPPLDPRRFARQLAPYFARLLDRAQHVGASDSCKRNLCVGALAELRLAAKTDDLGRLRKLVDLFEAVSRAAPEPSVDALVFIVERFGVEQLDAIHVSGSIRAVLDHASHRQISPMHFERLEATLYQLARSRGVDQPRQTRGGSQRLYGAAEPTWTRLFRPTLHLTRQPFEHRVAILRRRLESADPFERDLAVHALLAALDGESSVGWNEWDKIDGDWEHETGTELSHRHRELWTTLLELSNSEDPRTRALARNGLAHSFQRGLAIALGPEELARLATFVGDWTVEQRELLGQEVEDVLRSASEPTELDDPTFRAFELLRRALAPSDLRAELLAQVGRWHPGRWAIDASDRQQLEHECDVELAHKLIEQPEVLEQTFDWLCSPEAVRAWTFALALGRADTSLELLAKLREHSHDLAGHRFTAAYIAGWADIAGDAALDAWLDDARGHEPPELLVGILTTSPGNDYRAGMLVELIRDGALPGWSLTHFGLSNWSMVVSTTSLNALVQAMAKSDHDWGSDGVGLLDVRLSRDVRALPEELGAAAHTLLVRQLRAPASIGQRAWVRSILALAKQGDLEPLVNTARAVFNQPAYPHHVAQAIRQLVAEDLAEPTWDALAGLLDDAALRPTFERVLTRTPLLAALPLTHLLAWLDQDPERDATIARCLAAFDPVPGELMGALESRSNSRRASA